MTQTFVGKPSNGAICKRCSHDLETRADGHVWCSNPECWHNAGEPHPTSTFLNLPDGVEP